MDIPFQKIGKEAVEEWQFQSNSYHTSYSWFCLQGKGSGFFHEKTLSSEEKYVCLEQMFINE